MKYIDIYTIHDTFDSVIDKITAEAFNNVNDDNITDAKEIRKIDARRELLLTIENALDKYLGTIGNILGSQPYSAN